MEESGVVKSISGRMARVRVQKSPMCEKCSGGMCTMSEDGSEIEAINDIGATLGQQVEIQMPSGYVKSSLIAYGTPVIALIGGAIIGKEYLPAIFPGRNPETLSAIAGFGALAGTLLVVKLWSVFIHKSSDEHLPVIKRILEDQKS